MPIECGGLRFSCAACAEESTITRSMATRASPGMSPKKWDRHPMERLVGMAVK
jgi:hypothetical protein